MQFRKYSFILQLGVNPSHRHVKGDSSAVNPIVDVENQDDDVVVVSYTTSKSMRMTKASVAVLEKKKSALGVGGVDVEAADEPEKVVDVEELERHGEKKKASKKGKAKAKRPSTDQVGGSIPKKRKGVVISKPKSPARGDKFVVDDADESGEEDMVEMLRKRSKDKLKVNDNRNRINNMRIAKDVQDVPTKGIVRGFVCNISNDIADPDSPLFQKIKIIGHIFNFNPELINEHYGSKNEGIIEDAAAMLIKAYEEEQQRLEVEIQIKQVRVSELQTKIQALKAIVPLTVDDPITTSTAVPNEPPVDVAETAQSPT
ncbi:hypothetical protein LIER_24739 [Lithospermum erythrorhizon]|uniref:Uncharacterized protein n=1 Tax=Lithospermum erythrorhizon TaxID=34254 RepID=A0AAV3R295_LITER